MFPVASNRLFRASRLILHAFREFRLARNSRDTISAGREKKSVKRAKIDNRRDRKKGIVYRDGLNFPEVYKNVIPIPSW